MRRAGHHPSHRAASAGCSSCRRVPPWCFAPPPWPGRARAAVACSSHELARRRFHGGRFSGAQGDPSQGTIAPA